jgi:cytoskeletal protein CcmA (bactofilin family)
MTSCPSERTWLLHADGELPATEAQQLEAHLAECPRCAGLVAALRGENRLLARVLGEAVPATRATAPRLLPEVLVLTAGVVAAAVGLWLLTGWLSALGRDSPAALLDRRSLLVGLLVDAVFYLWRQGASMLDSILSALGVFGLVVLGGLLAVLLRRRWAKAVLVALILLSAGGASALEMRAAEAQREQVVVRAGETIDDSLVALGDTVVIDGTVTGNLIAAGRRTIVRGTVKGDLVTASKLVEVEGTVEGNVFSAGETVVLRGPVGRSVYGFAQELRLDRSGRVDGDLVGCGGEVGLDGHVGRDLIAFARATILRGEVSRKVSVRTGRLRLEGPARIGGDLMAHVKRAGDVEVDPEARIGGRTETRVAPPRKSRFASPRFYFWKLIWLGAAFVTGLLLHRLFPGLFATHTPDGASLLRASGVGFVVLVAVPAAAVLACATLVGLPIGLIMLMLWMSGLYVAPLLVAMPIGRGILQGGASPPASFVPALLVGLVVVTVLVNVPYVGGIVRLVVIVLGLGLGAMRLRRGAAVASV